MVHTKFPCVPCLKLGKDRAKFVSDFPKFLKARKEYACIHCYDALHTLTLVPKVFEFYGMKDTFETRKLVVSEFERIHDLFEKKLGLSYLKYKTSAFFSWGLRQDLPPFPKELAEFASLKGPHLFAGSYYAYSQRMRREAGSVNVKLRRKAWSFFYSILMLKKGLPRPSEDDCKAAVRKAYDVMTTPMDRPFTTCLAIDSVAEKMKKVVEKLFARCGGTGRRSDESWIRFWESVEVAWPSVSSHFGSNRASDGALSVIREEFDIDGMELEYEECKEECIMMDDFHRICQLTVASVNKLRELNRRMIDYALNWEKMNCIPQALPEPLKIRIVTAGPAVTYCVLRPVQKMLWAQCTADDRFLIGDKVSGKRIYKTLGRLRFGNKWLSGDYKAATDNLAIELSYRCVDFIADSTCMPPCYRELLHRSLTEHWYHYTDEEKVTHGPTPQARGQLMGSPTSFPFLCIANFALIWDTVYPELRFDQVECIVNGDDCLFQCDEDQKLAWEDGAEKVGLTPSIGKTYFSDRFAVINSEMFDMVITDEITVTMDGNNLDDYYEYIPFVNTGLILGLKRSGDKESSFVTREGSNSKDGKSVGARCQALMKGWEGEDKDDLFEWFLEFNAVDERIPLFIPEVWGGYGFPETPSYSMPVWEIRTLNALVEEDAAACPKSFDKAVSPFYCGVNELLKTKYGSVKSRVNSNFNDLKWLVMGYRKRYQEESMEEFFSLRDRLLPRAAVMPPFLRENWDVIMLGPTPSVPAVLFNRTEPTLRVGSWLHGADVCSFTQKEEASVPSEQMLQLVSQQEMKDLAHLVFGL